MFHWKIIIILIVLKVLSIIFAHYYYKSTTTNNKKDSVLNIKKTENEYGKYDKMESENETCITPTERNFMICWIKYTVDMIDCSKAIIKNLPNFNNYHTNLENTKDELLKSFADLYKDTNQFSKFKNIIDKQTSLKLSLCYAIKDEDRQKISLYSKLLTANTHEFGTLFGEIKKNKENEQELKSSLTLHTSLYVKSLGAMKKATNDELSRELIFGSITTVKLLL